MTSFHDELYAESRASIQEGLLPYVTQRIWAERTTAISEPRRFFVLSIGVYTCICASTSYVYNLFSGRLQEKYDFSQSDMSTITTAAVLIGLVIFPLAGIYDYYGPKPIFVVGMTAFPLGAALFGLAFSDSIEGSVWRFSVFYGLLCVGSSMFDIGSLMTVMTIFPSSRGAVIAVIKTYVGLGSAIFGAIQLGFFERDISGFFYFMAVVVTAVGGLSFAFICLPPYQLTGWEEAHLSEVEKRHCAASKKMYFEQVPPLRRFALGFLLVFILIVFLPTQSALVALYNAPHTWKAALAVVTIVLVMLSSTMALPLAYLNGGSEGIIEDINAPLGGSPDAGPEEDEYASPATQLRISMRMASPRRSIAEEVVFRLPVVNESEHIAPQYQTTFRESLRTPQLWVMTFSFFSVMGVQMVVIINARFIYAAIAGQPITSATVTMLTVFNGTGSAVGRVLMSLFEAWTQKRAPRERVPLTVALFIPSTMMLIASATLLWTPRELLMIPFALTALANGFGAATVVLVTRTIYAKDMANHYNFMSVGTILASFLLNRLLYGEWYSRMARKQGRNLCYGRECIFLPFAVMTALLLTSLAANYFVHSRYTNYCAQVLGPEPGTTSDPVPQTYLEHRGEQDTAYDDAETGQCQPLLAH